VLNEDTHYLVRADDAERCKSSQRCCQLLRFVDLEANVHIYFQADIYFVKKNIAAPKHKTRQSKVTKIDHFDIVAALQNCRSQRR
jgi:hypothetical protein